MDYEQALNTAISETSFCGENLEDDAGFQNFFFEAEGTPERFDGQTTLPAEPPDWRVVKKAATEYLEKTKDLKLIGILAQSVLNTESIAKFESCLRGLASLIEEQWEGIYPPLDEDEGDPMERVSALGHLKDTFVVNTLKNAPLASVKGFGNVTLDAIDKAVSGDDNAPMSLSQIKGIFSEIDPSENIALFEAVTQCSTHLNSINQTFIEKAGNTYNVDFSPTLDVLSQLTFALEKHANVKTEALQTEDETSGQNGETDTSSSGTASASQNNSAAAFSPSGQVSSRKDVEKCFALILDYYAAHEPSSPIPILINRANKLIHLDFLEIMQDIYPEALSTLHQLGGIEKEDSDDSSTTDDSW